MRQKLSQLVDCLQAKFPPNRLVLLASPFLAAASGWVVSQAPKVLPGIEVSPEFVSGLFAAGALAGAGYVYRFVDGIQRDEAMKQEAEENRRARLLKAQLEAVDVRLENEDKPGVE